jgi:uncharacterized protein YndB with AHSA1/START domain
MKNNSVQLHRVIRSTPEKVYQAFLNADAMARWLPPYGILNQVHHLDARVGGTFKMAFSGFATGQGHSFGGTYLELIPGKLIRYTTTFDDPQLPGEMLVRAEISAVSCGVSLHIEQSNIPSVIPTELCYLGWQESIAQLINLVEPNV